MQASPLIHFFIFIPVVRQPAGAGLAPYLAAASCLNAAGRSFGELSAGKHGAPRGAGVFITRQWREALLPQDNLLTSILRLGSGSITRKLSSTKTVDSALASTSLEIIVRFALSLKRFVLGLMPWQGKRPAAPPVQRI